MYLHYTVNNTCCLKYLKESKVLEWKACGRHQIFYDKLLHTWPSLHEKPLPSISPFERRPFVFLSVIILFVEFCYLVNLHETGLAGPPMHAAIIALGGLGNN
jgi:hypothetical protein